MNDPRHTAHDTNNPFAPPVPRDITPRDGYTYDPVAPLPDHLQPPPPPEAKNRLRDVDTAESAFTLKIASYSLAGSLITAGIVAIALILEGSAAVVAGAIVTFIISWLMMYNVGGWLANRSGGAAGAILFPSGASTPGARQYSLAQSYVARGLYAQAATEYERCANAYPTDPEPLLRLARLYRDDLQRYDDAVSWFKRTLTIAKLPSGTETMAMRELIEVYTHRMQQPAAAAPWLARLAARFPGTPASDWAKQQLAEMKADMRNA